MAKDITFIVHSDWLHDIEGLSIEQQDKIIADWIRYGAEVSIGHADDPITVAFLNTKKRDIDYSKNKFAEKQAKGKTGGAKVKVSDQEIWQIASLGNTAQEVADSLGISVSKVNHSEGWKNRDKKDWGNLQN